MTSPLTGASQEQIRDSLTAALILAYRQLLESGTAPTTVHVHLEFALMQAGVDLAEATKGVKFPALQIPTRRAPVISLAYAAGEAK